MSARTRMPRVAILDDYAGMALRLADWSPVQTRSEVTVFDRHLSEPEAAEAATAGEPIESIAVEPSRRRVSI